MSKSIARIAFYFVAVVLFTWTASLTYSFVASALPNLHWLVPALSLVIFDAGMLAWLFVFLYHAEGNTQRAIAGLICAFDLIGVGLMVISEILLGGQTWTVPPESLGDYAIWGMGIWTVANVAAVVAFHAADPAVRQKMALQAEKDAVFEEALARLTQKRTAVSGQLSDRLAEGMMAQLVAELAADRNRDGIPDVWQAQSPSANSRPPVSRPEGNV